MKVFIAFEIFAVIAAGEALQCLQCKAINEQDCSGESVECSGDGYVCAKGMEHNIEDGDLISSVFRGCIKHYETCGRTTTLSTTRFQISFSNECCSEDNCNFGPIPVPTKNTTATGLACQSCYIAGRTVCPEYQPIQCVGNEGECLEYYGKASRPGKEILDYYFSGCVTPRTCKVGYVLLVGSKVYESNHLDCPKSFEIEN